MKPFKKVLIPTDFSIASLNLVREAAEQAADHKLEIVLIYGLHLSSSITELLFFSKNKVINSLQSADFMEACSLLKNKYLSKIDSIHPDLLIGNNRNYLHHYLEAEGFDTIYVPANYKLNDISRQYFDPTPLLYKAEMGVTMLNWPGSSQMPFVITNQLSDLFLPG